MRNAFRNGALACGLIAGAMLISAPPAEARSFQRDGYFGGTWSPIGPRDNRYVHRYYRRYGPSYYAYAAPGYFYGPSYYDYGPGISFGFGF